MSEQKHGAPDGALSIEERGWSVLTCVSDLRAAVAGLQASLDERILAWERDAMDAIEELSRERSE